MKLIEVDRLIKSLKDEAYSTGGICNSCTDIDCISCIIDNVIKFQPIVDSHPLQRGKRIEQRDMREFDFKS